MVLLIGSFLNALLPSQCLTIVFTSLLIGLVYLLYRGER